MFGLFCLFLVFIKSDDIEVDGFTYRIQDKKATVIKCTIEDSILTIPAKVTVDEVICPVVGITNGAFSTTSKNYTEIYFPNSIFTIESNTFQAFTSLQKIGYIDTNNETVPDSLPTTIKRLESMTFQGCSSLQKINLYHVQTIDVSCFDSCSALTKVESSTSLQSIGPSAFSHCPNLVSFTTQSTQIHTVGSMAFAYCAKLEEFNFSVCLAFDDSAFKGTGFTSVNLSGCTTGVINSDLFSMCSKLVSVTFPQHVVALYSECFYQCTSLTSIEILSVGSDFTIERAAFQECTSLKSVVLVSQPRFIGVNAFYGCTSLESVTLLNPSRNQAMSLFQYCFFGCTNLTTFAFENWTLFTIEEMAFYQCPLSSNLTFYGSGQFSINNLAFQSQSIQFLDFRNCQSLDLTRQSFQCPNLTCVIVNEDQSILAQLAFPGIRVSLDERCLPAPTLPPTKTPMASRTPRPTESPTQSATQAPTEVPTEPPTEEPTSQAPTEQPTEPPTEEPTPDDSTSNKKKTIIIASSVSAVVLVIILIIVAVLIIRKRRNVQLESKPLLTQDNDEYFMKN